MGHQGEGLSKKTLTHSQCLIFKNLKDEKKKKRINGALYSLLLVEDRGEEGSLCTVVLSSFKSL